MRDARTACRNGSNFTVAFLLTLTMGQSYFSFYFLTYDRGLSATNFRRKLHGLLGPRTNTFRRKKSLGHDVHRSRSLMNFVPLYTESGLNLWCDEKQVDSLCKNEWKICSGVLSWEALFTRKSNLKIGAECLTSAWRYYLRIRCGSYNQGIEADQYFICYAPTPLCHQNTCSSSAPAPLQLYFLNKNSFNTVKK